MFFFYCGGCLLLCAWVSLVVAVGATLLWGSHCGGFSCGVGALGACGLSSCSLSSETAGWMVVVQGLVAPACEIFPDQKLNPCLLHGQRSWILYHWATRAFKSRTPSGINRQVRHWEKYLKNTYLITYMRNIQNTSNSAMRKKRMTQFKMV